MFHLTKIRDPIGQPMWDSYETGGPKPYQALLGRNVGKIWEKCGQDLGPIWATHMGQKLYGPHIVVQVCVLTGFISKSFF